LVFLTQAKLLLSPASKKGTFTFFLFLRNQYWQRYHWGGLELFKFRVSFHFFLFVEDEQAFSAQDIVRLTGRFCLGIFSKDLFFTLSKLIQK
jgi:hypothetical protein